MSLQIQHKIAPVLNGQRSAAQIDVAGQLNLSESGADPVLNQPPQRFVVPRGGLREFPFAAIVDHREAVVLHVIISLDGLPLFLRPAVIDVLECPRIKGAIDNPCHAVGYPDRRQIAAAV